MNTIADVKFVELFQALGDKRLQVGFIKWFEREYEGKELGLLLKSLNDYIEKGKLDTSLVAIWKKVKGEVDNEHEKTKRLNNEQSKRLHRDFNELKNYLDDYLLYIHYQSDKANFLAPRKESKEEKEKREKERKLKRYELLYNIYDSIGKIDLFKDSFDNYLELVDKNIIKGYYQIIANKRHIEMATGRNSQFSDEDDKKYYETFFQSNIDEGLFVIIQAICENKAALLPFEHQEYVGMLKQTYQTKNFQTTNTYFEMYDVIVGEVKLEKLQVFLGNLDAKQNIFHTNTLADMCKILVNHYNHLTQKAFIAERDKQEKREDIIYVACLAQIVDFMLRHKLYYISQKIPITTVDRIIRIAWKYNALKKLENPYLTNLDILFKNCKRLGIERGENISLSLLEIMYIWCKKDTKELSNKINECIKTFRNNHRARETPIFYFLRIKTLYEDSKFAKEERSQVKRWIDTIVKCLQEKEGKEKRLLTHLFEYEMAIWRFIMEVLEDKNKWNETIYQKQYEQFIEGLSPNSPTFFHDKSWYYEKLQHLKKEIDNPDRV